MSYGGKVHQYDHGDKVICPGEREGAVIGSPYTNAPGSTVVAVSFGRGEVLYYPTTAIRHATEKPPPATKKRLFRVDYHVTAFIAAEDEAAARRHATEMAFREDVSDVYLRQGLCATYLWEMGVGQRRRLDEEGYPPGWDEECYPYGYEDIPNLDDRPTIEEMLAVEDSAK